RSSARIYTRYSRRREPFWFIRRLSPFLLPGVPAGYGTTASQSCCAPRRRELTTAMAQWAGGVVLSPLWGAQRSSHVAQGASWSPKPAWRGAIPRRGAMTRRLLQVETPAGSTDQAPRVGERAAPAEAGSSPAGPALPDRRPSVWHQRVAECRVGVA